MVTPPRHFLKLTDLRPEEHRALFARAAELKRRRRAHTVDTTLAGRTLVLLMEKASTRTRLSFAAAIGQLGGHAVELSSASSQLARGEPLSDTARVVSGYADAVVFRTSTDARLEEQSGRESAAQRLAARKARRVRSDDELLHMSADGTVSTIANSQRPVLITDEDETGEDADD